MNGFNSPEANVESYSSKSDVLFEADVHVTQMLNLLIKSRHFKIEYSIIIE
jgi:hypothetical protein